MYIRKITRYLVVMVVSFTAITACDDSKDNDIFDVRPDEQQPETASEGVDEVSTIPLTVYTSRLEVPALKVGNVFVEHSTLEGRDSLVNYMFEFSPSHHLPHWVAFRFDASNRAITVNRKSYNIDPQYPADPDLKGGLSSDASFGGFQHGHMCASHDRRYSREANDQTFYISNMMPQSGNFNGDYWTIYENFVQTKGRTASFADTLYVVKGGTLDQYRQNITIDGYVVPVPRYFWMALLRVKGTSYSAIGFWMEHRDDYPEIASSKVNAEILEHAVTIDRLESLTGINFFPNLPDDVERTVEASYAASSWGL